MNDSNVNYVTKIEYVYNLWNHYIKKVLRNDFFNYSYEICFKKRGITQLSTNTSL